VRGKPAADMRLYLAPPGRQVLRSRRMVVVAFGNKPATSAEVVKP